MESFVLEVLVKSAVKIDFVISNYIMRSVEGLFFQEIIAQYQSYRDLNAYFSSEFVVKHKAQQ